MWKKNKVRKLTADYKLYACRIRLNYNNIIIIQSINHSYKLVSRARHTAVTVVVRIFREIFKLFKYYHIISMHFSTRKTPEYYYDRAV